MTPAELTDTAVGVYQELGGMVLRFTAVPTLLCVAALVFVTAFVFPALSTTNHPGNMSYQVGEAISALFIGLIVGGPLLGIGIGYSGVIITGIASDYMNGEVPDPAMHARNARKLLWKVIVLCFTEVVLAMSAILVSSVALILSSLFSDNPNNYAAGLVVFIAVLGLVAGVVIAFAVVVRNILALPVLVIEGRRPREALRRGRQLMNARLYQPPGTGSASNALGVVILLIFFIGLGCLGLFDLFGLPNMIDSGLAGSPFHDLVLYAISALPWFLTMWSIVPVWCVSATVLYYERRTRLEGYDIQALARDLTKHGKENRFDV